MFFGESGMGDTAARRGQWHRTHVGVTSTAELSGDVTDHLNNAK